MNPVFENAVYPMYGVDTRNGVVVELTAYGVGTVYDPGRSAYLRGHYCDRWDMDTMKPTKLASEWFTGISVYNVLMGLLLAAVIVMFIISRMYPAERSTSQVHSYEEYAYGRAVGDLAPPETFKDAVVQEVYRRQYDRDY